MFPSEIKLIDTGERRYPVYDEYYCYHNPKTDEINGPFLHEYAPRDEDGEFCELANRYAIYRKVE